MKTTLAFLISLSAVCADLTTMAAAQQFVSSRSVAYTASAPIYGVADFNADGRLDFLAGNTIMLQTSNGTFTPKQLTSVTSPYPSSVVADINGDGKADIVAVNSAQQDQFGNPVGTATLTVYLGNGNGTFTPKSPIALKGDLGNTYVLASDLNHDGKLDIITVSSTDTTTDVYLQTFLNAGSGNLTAGPTYAGNLTGGKLFVAADFNGDGFPDLAVDNGADLQILTGKGDGSFTPGASYALSPLAAGVGDFNKDGHQDLVVVGPQTGTILLGNGNGTFTTGSALNTEFLTFVPASQQPTFDYNQPINVYVGDLNKDGKLDIAITSESDTITVATYFGTGSGTFGNPKAYNIAELGGTPSSAFGDFNQDGNTDVLAGSGGSAGVVTLALGDGSGGFKAPAISQTPNPGSIVSADFNHDGIEDIAVVNEPLCSSCTTTSVTVFLGSGKGYFLAPVNYSIPVNRGMIAAGDINNDGKVDLVVARNPKLLNSIFNNTPTSTEDVAVLLGKGDGTFETPVGYHLLGAPKGSNLNSQVYLEDVNKDGKLDLIGDWGVALGNGTGQFGTPIALPSTISGIVAMAPGDFNNTGTIGLAVATNTSFTSPGNLYVLAGSSNGSFHVISQKALTAEVSALITTDLNGDHRTDILYTTVSPYEGASPKLTLTVELSDTGNYGFATTNYTLAAQLPAFSNTQNDTILVGDFNGDGKMDVAIPALFEDAGDLALLLGTGGGALNNSPQHYQGFMDLGVVLDVNGDGAPDIVGTTSIGVARLVNAQ